MRRLLPLAFLAWSALLGGIQAKKQIQIVQGELGRLETYADRAIGYSIRVGEAPKAVRAPRSQVVGRVQKYENDAVLKRGYLTKNQAAELQKVPKVSDRRSDIFQAFFGNGNRGGGGGQSEVGDGSMLSRLRLGNKQKAPQEPARGSRKQAPSSSSSSKSGPYEDSMYGSMYGLLTAKVDCEQCPPSKAFAKRLEKRLDVEMWKGSCTKCGKLRFRWEDSPDYSSSCECGDGGYVKCDKCSAVVWSSASRKEDCKCPNTKIFTEGPKKAGPAAHTQLSPEELKRILAKGPDGVKELQDLLTRMGLMSNAGMDPNSFLFDGKGRPKLLLPESRNAVKQGEFPWVSVVRVMMADSFCSGLIVGKWLVLTAKHCNAERGAKVYPDVFGKVDQEKGGTVKTVLDAPERTEAEGRKNHDCDLMDDWSLLIMDKPLGKDTFIPLWPPSDPLPEGQGVFSNGAYGSKFLDTMSPTYLTGIKLWETKGHRGCDVYGPLRTNALTTGGMSGSSLLFKKDGRYYTVGALFGSEREREYDFQEWEEYNSIFSGGPNLYATWEAMTLLTQSLDRIDAYSDMDS